MGRECSRLWEVDAYRERRLGAKDAASFERHVATCASCAARMERDEKLRGMVRALPDDAPADLDLRRTRARVIRDLATDTAPARRPWRAAGVAAAVALVGLGAWMVVRGASSVPGAHGTAAVAIASPVASSSSPEEAAEPFAGSVLALADSRWTQSRSDGTERVTLERGWVRIHVRPQHAGERFLVMLPDGELEVRGTTFEVAVDGAATTDVHVDDGVVELRLTAAPARKLGAGEMWRASVPAVARVEVAGRAPSGGSLPPAPGASASSRRELDQGASAEFNAAMQLLLAGRNPEASSAFESFVLAHPASARIEDATYLDAVALARAGRTDAAALAAEQHLRRFPGSFHRKEAATVIALAASLRGDCTRARAVVAEWTAGTPDADVRSALRACEGK